jgi:hypothetical protein
MLSSTRLGSGPPSAAAAAAPEEEEEWSSRAGDMAVGNGGPLRGMLWVSSRAPKETLLGDSDDFEAEIRLFSVLVSLAEEHQGARLVGDGDGAGEAAAL